MRSEFVANVSHELRTPITAIKGFAETLLDDDVNDEDRKKFLGIIYEESIRLDRLIHDTLVLSKIEQEKAILRYEKFEIEYIIEEILLLLNSTITEKEIKLELTNGSMQVHADRDKIRQILLNLIANAVNYTLPKGKVWIFYHENQQHFVFIVKDTGIGIPQESINRIFERFYRVDKARSRSSVS